MSRYVCLVVFLLGALAGPAKAQDGNGGVLLGVNMASLKLTGDVPSDTSNRTGFMAGLFGSWNAGPSFAVEPGVFFVQGGSKFSDSGVSGTIKVNFIQIPVLFVGKAPIGTGSRLRIFAGPAFAIRSGDAKIESGGGSQSLTSDVIERTDTEVIFGAGLDIQKFLIDVRYMLGLRDLDKDPASEAKTRGLAILAGVRF